MYFLVLPRIYIILATYSVNSKLNEPNLFIRLLATCAVSMANTGLSASSENDLFRLH